MQPYVHKLRSNWQVSLLLALGLIGLMFSIHGVFANGHYLWDLRVYQDASLVAANGDNAYAQGYPNLRFVYAPAVLWGFAAISPWLSPIFLSLYALVIACVIFKAPSNFRLAVVLIFAVLFVTRPLAISVATGNVNIFLHLTIALLWFSAWRWRAHALLLTIALAALMKPQFAAYFILWGLHQGRWTADSTRAASALALVALAWGAQALLAPDSFAAFLAALKEQLDFGGAKQNIGIGLYYFAQRLGASQTLALLVHIVIWAALALAWLTLIRPKLAEKPTPNTTELLALGPLILCLLISPRFKIYDEAMLYLFCIQAVLIWGALTPRAALQPVLGLTLVLVPLQVAPEMLHLAQDQQRGLFLAIMLSAFVLSCRRATTDTAVSAQATSTTRLAMSQ